MTNAIPTESRARALAAKTSAANPTIRICVVGVHGGWGVQAFGDMRKGRRPFAVYKAGQEINT